MIVGSGYIGVEMADALTRRGVHVTMLGRAPRVLPTVDPPFGMAVACNGMALKSAPASRPQLSSATPKGECLCMARTGLRRGLIWCWSLRA